MVYKDFTRQPRFLPELPVGEKTVESPPPMPQKPEVSWLTVILPPAVMICVTALIALNFSGSSFMLISLCMTFMALINSLITISRQKKKYADSKKLRESKYLQYISDMRTELTVMKKLQVSALSEMNPEPEVCLNRVRNTDSKLWEKTPAHSDFLCARVGMGNVPFAIKLQSNTARFNLEEDPLANEPEKIVLDFAKVNNAPVCLDLFNSEICGIAGDNNRVMSLLNAVLLQIVTFHGYDDVNIVLLLKDENIQKLSWARFLPHLWDTDYKIRYMACGSAMAHQVLSTLNDVIKSRELNRGSASPVLSQMLPHYVFVVDDLALLDKEPIAKYLFNPHKDLGVSSLFLASNKAYLPMNCNIVISALSKAHELLNKADGSKSLYNPDQVDENKLDFCGRQLAPLRIKSAFSHFSLPKSITLNQMYNINKAEEIDLAARWQVNKTFKGMSVPIGARAGGELFNLDMHETGYGPHGLVAGTTGSGKSELLQSIIISLAMNFHPHDVVFVLIDYKGGGMADAFKGLPHLVGTITNLGGNQTTRALISIKSELQRRQRIFSDHDVNNIDKYQKLYHNGGAATPIPHLIMIADEFAELKAEQPEFMKELVSTARVGRSLGVHLILATQKPGGIVDDQIWSNSKFKICLKVQDSGDSKDVIKRDDAAYIKEVGRAYIQVGNDEVFEMFQSAYAGADYNPEPEDGHSVKQEQNVYKVALNGRFDKIYPSNEEKIAKDELPSQLKAMVSQIINTAQRLLLEALPGPWPPPLEDSLFLDDVLDFRDGFDYQSGAWKNAGCLGVRIKPLLGIYDNPREQIQDKLAFNFTEDGNLFVYGMAGSGKTVFLQTLCLSLAHSYSPQEASVYILDFGGGGLRRLEALPHIGGVITVEEEYRLNQFMIFIFHQIEERKKAFFSAKADGFASFKEKSSASMPAIFILLDNYTALAEVYDGIAEQMLSLSRECLKYGIYIVATATRERAYRFSANFKMAVAFEMTDKGEYDSLVGRCHGLEPAKNDGRALLRHNPPLEFQTANCCFRDKSLEEIVEIYEKHTQTGRIKAALPIPQMPDTIDIFALNSEPSGTVIKVGLLNDDLQAAGFDLSLNHLLLVTGDPGSGKSTMLVSMANLLLKSSQAKFYVKDSVAAGLYPLLSQDMVINIDELADELDFMDEVTALLEERRNELLQCRKSGGELQTLKDSWRQIVFIFDDLLDFVDNNMGNVLDLFERIAKKEHGLKIAIWAAGNTNDIGSSYDSFVKAFKNAQCGLIFGSLKEQNVFNVRLPYGAYEKTEFGLGDGYLIAKNKYAGIKGAVDLSLI
ncbi:MAG: type VII secretion protein EssC [Clostridiales bacterium]|nr:type VII secretion protein EssC [Clostridiales bacterium]